MITLYNMYSESYDIYSMMSINIDSTLAIIIQRTRICKEIIHDRVRRHPVNKYLNDIELYKTLYQWYDECAHLRCSNIL